MTLLSHPKPASATSLQKRLPPVYLLLGPPGAGKGTHAPMLSHVLKVPHISTGDLFREHIRSETPVGKKAKEYIDLGQLVPDEIVLDMVFLRLAEPDANQGVILDGFPRTLAQAQAFEKKMPDFQFVAFFLNVDTKTLIERITGRLVCKSCGRPFHKQNAAPQKEGVCDSCGGVLYQRSDDSEEVLKKRLFVFEEQTKPLIDYYKSKEALIEVNAVGQAKDILTSMLRLASSKQSLEITC